MIWWLGLFLGVGIRWEGVGVSVGVGVGLGWFGWRGVSGGLASEAFVHTVDGLRLVREIGMFWAFIISNCK
jgi:hypothetical protein